VDAFTSHVLLDCQRASIVDVDHRMCVSQYWADRVKEEFGARADVVANGVDAQRFANFPLDRTAAGVRLGWGDRPVVLAVGGIEPRKGSRLLIEAFARARGRLGDGALLAIGGGETLFDYREYRDAWHRDAERLGLAVHTGAPGRVPDDADVAILGTIEDDELPALYRAADALAFPSTREGFGLVVLEALASGIPAVVTDLPVLREHLKDDRDCIMVPAADSGLLSNALVSAVRDRKLRARLLLGGRETAARFTWEACAEEHERIYGRILERHPR
jgi:glycosyltransferase involved in cell wall biosynthesis